MISRALSLLLLSCSTPSLLGTGCTCWLAPVTAVGHSGDRRPNLPGEKVT